MKRRTFTPEEVKNLEKKEKCQIIHISVYLDDDRNKKPDERQRIECLVKDPLSLDNLSIMSAMLSLENKLEVGEYMLDNLWIDGDSEFQRGEGASYVNAKARYTAATMVANAISRYDAAIVKH